MEINKRGTLRFWGDWFGRPYDNYHTVKSADLKEEESGTKCIDAQDYYALELC